MMKRFIALGAALVLAGLGLTACESHAQYCKSHGGVVHSVRVNNRLAHYCTVGGKVIDRW